MWRWRRAWSDNTLLVAPCLADTGLWGSLAESGFVPVIRFHDVTMRYPAGHEALRSVNLRVPPGQMVFITGHSGAGKSTMLRLITLIERCSRGQVVVGGHNLSRMRARHIPLYRRHLGVVFQDHRLLAERTVFDNVALPLVAAGYRHGDVRRRVRAALDLVGLLKKDRLLPGVLSGGEQQRIGIARAVVHRPSLLLADEPTGNLDPKLSRYTMALFERFNQIGGAVVIATHDLDLARSMSHRIITLHEGSVVDDTGAGR